MLSIILIFNPQPREMTIVPLPPLYLLSSLATSVLPRCSARSCCALHRRHRATTPEKKAGLGAAPSTGATPLPASPRVSLARGGRVSPVRNASMLPYARGGGLD